MDGDESKVSADPVKFSFPVADCMFSLFCCGDQSCGGLFVAGVMALEGSSDTIEIGPSIAIEVGFARKSRLTRFFTIASSLRRRGDDYGMRELTRLEL